MCKYTLELVHCIVHRRGLKKNSLTVLFFVVANRFRRILFLVLLEAIYLMKKEKKKVKYINIFFIRGKMR